jgi:glyoxylase-like metal-dependent hydrolase (beta-lactamase superfamily II)
MEIPMRWLFQSRGRPGRTLDAQMREAGMDPARVRWVIISHLHSDHVGSAPAFSGATFVGGPGTSGHVFEGGFAPRWRTIDPAGSKPMPPFDAALDLFGDASVWIVSGGGHTREDILALVALPAGPVLLAGDAVVHRDWLASDDVERVATDPERAADVRNRVRALVQAAPQLTLVPGHDLRALPQGREDIAIHHPEYLGLDAWPLSDPASESGPPGQGGR